MTCRDAANLLNARVDGELAGADAAALDAHLAGCAACQALAAELESQDAALLRAFALRRSAAAEVAERVAATMAAESSARQANGTDADASPAEPTRPTARPRWLPWAAAAVVAIATAGIAFVVVRPWAARPPVNATRPGTGPVVPPTPAVFPVAHLTLATGNVFTCPSAGDNWSPLAPGASVPSGSRVRTDDAAKCELSLPAGGTVRMNAGTEARFADDRVVQVSAGQVWSAVPPGGPPLRVTAGARGPRVTSGGAGAWSQVGVAAGPARATVTVVRGDADVNATAGTPAKLPTTVRGGQVLSVDAVEPNVFLCVPISDPVLAASWLDELLVLKPADDPEVVARVGELLARIAQERARPGDGATRPTGPGRIEQEVRARGGAWSAPIAGWLTRTTGEPPSRRAAARLLADLAPPRVAPDLIRLLDDADGEIRAEAATGLRRLAGQDLGFPPDRMRAARDEAAVAAWRAWWERTGVGGGGTRSQGPHRGPYRDGAPPVAAGQRPARRGSGDGVHRVPQVAVLRGLFRPASRRAQPPRVALS